MIDRQIRKRLLRLIPLLAVLAVSGFRANAQTITIDPSTATTVSSQGGYLHGSGYDVSTPIPRVLTDYNSSTGYAIYFFCPASWVEIPFTVATTGIYSASIEYAAINDNVAIQIDVRRAGTENHWVSPDLALTNTNDLALSSPPATVTTSGIRLTATGNYILRVRNVSWLRSTATTRPQSFQYDAVGFNPRPFTLGAVKLTRTGAATTGATISGKVTSTGIGNVGKAWVMAAPSGTGPAEPGPFWQQGFWTQTNADGSYSLSVGAGTYKIHAGRPDTYVLPGYTSNDITISAGGMSITNITLPSRWGTLTDGRLTLLVQSEYFFSKNPDSMPALDDVNQYNESTVLITGDWYSDGPPGTNPGGTEGNGFKVGYMSAGDYMDYYVDVPTGKGGQYMVTLTYYNGNDTAALYRFTANPGTVDENSTEGSLPSTPGNYVAPQIKVFNAPPLTLKAGLNIIRQHDVEYAADTDSFRLTQIVEEVPGAINPDNATFVWATGEASAGFVTTPTKPGDGTITNFTKGSYVEIPFSVDAPGLYKLTTPVATNIDDGMLQFDIRPEGTEAHYSTPDMPVPNTGGMGNFNHSIVVDELPLLTAGNYILRVRNTTRLHNHTAANREPQYMSDFSVNPPVFRSTAVNFGTMVITKTYNLPPTAVISGKVLASDIGNFGVQGAWVMAVPTTTTSVEEPGPFHQKGFWTTTAADGSYSLPVLAGSYVVQAGRPDMYAFAGSNKASSSPASGETSTVDLSLPSRYYKTTAGKYEVQVEAEYFFAKPTDVFGTGGYAPSVIALQGVPAAQNGIRPGYTDPGDFIDIHVDVPVGAAGLYWLSHKYFNGYWDNATYPDGDIQFTANPGTANENYIYALHPNTTPKNEDGSWAGGPAVGYDTPGVLLFPDPLDLLEGHNVIKIELTGGSTTFDAFVLSEVNEPVAQPGAGEALRIAAGLKAGPPAGSAFAALDVVVDNKITIADAVSLAKQGKL